MMTPQQDAPARVVPRRPRPATDSLARATGFGIPPDLLLKARRRLASLALALSILFAVTATLSAAVRVLEGGLNDIGVDSVDVLLAVAAAGVFAAARSSRVGHTLVFKIGLGWEVLICLAISVGNLWSVYGQYGHVPLITFTSIIIVVFPLIVPSPPAWTLVTSVASAATAPLAVWIVGVAGNVTFTASDYFTVAVAPALCAAIAVFGSRVIYGISLEIARARQMGSYELVAPLGSGGMGEVWRANHRYLARPAALKLIRPETVGTPGQADVAFKRFEREAQATAALRSHHTINLYDFGVTDDGTFYYVMELLGGIDIDALVRGHGPLPPGRAIHLLLQACDSLGEAHERGLVHRDIKPANLFVCDYGRERDFVKVLDFGIVAVRRNDDARANLTMEGTIVGTPAFMAPEAAVDESSFDHRLDLYALGCVAYWMLTAQLVFDASSAMKMVLRHATEAPAPPSQRTEVPVPAEFEAVVMACLEKHPADRPQSADELAERLRACQVPPWTAADARQWWDLHRPIDTSSGAPGPGAAPGVSA